MKVPDANILVHTRMADTYNEREPHFRPENQAQVRKVLESIRARSGGKLLDLGCGTGFIIDLADGLFDEIHGIDITEAMLAKVDTSREHVTTHLGSADALPFEDDSFDVVTSYAFLHHLEDYKPVFDEVRRVLRPGGIFYVDLEPNAHFWRLASHFDVEEPGDYSDIVRKEIHSVCHTDDDVMEEYGIAKDVFNAAEHIKSIAGGIFGETLRTDALEAGFSTCDVQYQWYAGQGKVLHEQSAAAAETVDGYLREMLPLSRSLYKYIRFIITR